MENDCQKSDLREQCSDNTPTNEHHSRRRLVSVSAQQIFEGPLPPPKLLEGYERICPGAADRIIKMAENQSSHRMSIEKIMVKSGSRDSLLGVVFAFFLGLSGVCASVFLFTLEKNFPGYTIFITSLFTLVGSAIAGKKANSDEIRRKKLADTDGENE